MRNRLVSTFAGICLLLGEAPLRAQNGRAQSFEVSSTERLPCAARGTVHIDGSYGYLSVDGWDAPEVEIAVTKTTDRFFGPSQQDAARRRLEQIRVTAERTEESLLTVKTTCPSRNGTWAPPLKATTQNGVTVDTRIHVPSGSHLVIHHDNGYVWVSGLAGDIEIHSHTGDMIVVLSDAASYAIDARTKLGSITSDFDGKRLSRFLLGTHFAGLAQAPAHRVCLRMGRGSITIKKDSPPAVPKTSLGTR